MRISNLQDIEKALNRGLAIENDNMSQYSWYKPKDKPSTALRFYKRLLVFKGANVEFNPLTMVATSYRWWIFVKKIKGKLVFNNYNYSSSTAKHQRKVRSVLDSLGIKIDLTIAAPRGLQDLDSAIKHYEYENTSLQAQIAKPKSRKATNLQRKATIERNLKTIEQIKKLMVDTVN